jgi:hypothetical protein
MDISTIYKFNKLIKSHNDETSDTKKKSISKNITKHVLNLKKNNKDRTKILNSYRKWLKNNNTSKNVQNGGGSSIDIFNNIKKKLDELKTNAATFTETITSLQEMFKNPQPSTSFKDNIISSLSKNTNPLSPESIQGLFNLFNNKNLLGNIINNYYNIFNFKPLTDILANASHGTQKGYLYGTKSTNPYVKGGQFNDVIFSKIATGTFYEKKPNQISKNFYSSYNINAIQPKNIINVKKPAVQAATPPPPPPAQVTPPPVIQPPPPGTATTPPVIQPPPPPPLQKPVSKNLSKYVNMIKKGVPQLAVERNMRMNSMSENNIKKVIALSLKQPTLAASTPPPPPPKQKTPTIASVATSAMPKIRQKISARAAAAAPAAAAPVATTPVASVPP